MADNQLNDLLLRVQRLEDRLRNGELTDQGIKEGYKELEKSVQEVKGIVQALSTRMSVQDEKYAHVSYQVAKLEETVGELEAANDQDTDHKRDMVENIFMVVLGAIVTFIFGMINK